ncbi:MAG: ABC transporter ATP-binding protein [Candidatus Limnocylindrales bacterium]
MLLEIDNVSKSYRGGARANQGVTLSVDAGEVYGLLGHNGAGKTTLASQVVGLLRPDQGSIRIDGLDAVARPAEARRRSSIQPQAQVPIDGLTPRQAIDLVGRLRGAPTPEVRRRSSALTAALDIGEWLDVDGGRLSGGVKRLVSFCMAAVTPGRVVILDEPTNDVDPVRRRLLWGLVRTLADGGAAVLLVTHNVLEAERAVDRLAILDHGRVLVEGTPGALKADLAGDLRLELVLEPGARPLVPAPFVRRWARNGHRMLAAVPNSLASEAAAWGEQLQRQGLIEEFSLAPATLEDVDVGLVGRADVTGDAAPISVQEELVGVHAA